MHAIRRTDIEMRVREALRVLQATSKIEDTGLELKGSPPAPEAKAAQLAGAANASGGEPIVWVFGIAEDGSFVSISGFDFDQWFAKIPGQFDGPYPEPTTALLEHDGNAILAASFRTDHAPYVVKRITDPRQREVPWREGSLTRTATRSELIRMLLPQVRLPHIEVIGGGIDFQPRPGLHPDLEKGISFSAQLFIEPVDSVGFHLSQHRCGVTIQLGERMIAVPTNAVTLRSAEEHQNSQTANIRPTATGLQIQGAGSFYIHTDPVGSQPVNALNGVNVATVTLSLGFSQPIGRVYAEIKAGPITNPDRMMVKPGATLSLVRQ